MLERFKAQLKEFREDDEARWKYEAEELQRQMHILKGMGRTDEQVKAELKRAGINLSVLEEESAKSAQKLEQTHKELLKIKPPPAKHGCKEQIMLQNVAAVANVTDHMWLFPPAFEGWGNAEECGFNLELGEFNIKMHSTGLGGDWGWGDYSALAEYCTMWFYYFPPHSGELLVVPSVDFYGSVAVNAHDHWYTDTHAEMYLLLHFDLYQHYWDGNQIVTIIHENRRKSSAAYWFDHLQVVSKTLSVSANDIVWIKLTISFWAAGVSSHAHVDCDFRTGASRRIKVPYIWVSLK